MLTALAAVSLSCGAGALSTLSPCVLPILPIVLFGALAAALTLVGGLVLTGFDKTVEATLTRAMPDRLVTVTTRL